MVSLSSPHFTRLMAALKRHKKTCTVIESSCGGLINASILAQPGASAVYYGGSIAYNTKFAKPLLLNDTKLHSSLMTPWLSLHDKVESERDMYLQSKLEWTRQTAIAFCEQVGTDICIAEGGATGPTFRPKDVSTGFAVIAIAAKQPNGQVTLVEQQIVESSTALRQENMRLFADEAAKLAYKVVVGRENDNDNDHPPTTSTDWNDSDTTSKPTTTTTSSSSSHGNCQKPHFDRATHVRGDTDKLKQLASVAHYVVLYGNLALFQTPDTSSPSTHNNSHHRQLYFLNQQEIQTVVTSLGGVRQEISFLGLLNDTLPIFSVDLLLDSTTTTTMGATPDNTVTWMEDIIHSTLHNTTTTDNTTNNTTNKYCHFQDTRTVAPLLNPNTCENEIVLYATALAQWQRRAPYCTACGSTTLLMDGGTSRICSKCQQRTWPRQDPSMIAVVANRDDTKILLARSPRHPTKLYTGLAGFVEAGETMEHAVAREVYEETGIRVDPDTTKYVASQPWPFPQSTMIGFLVQADDTQTLSIDTNELVEAAWFTRSQVQLATTIQGPVMQHDVADAAMANNPDLSLLIPPKGVLARRLIDTWLEGTCNK